MNKTLKKTLSIILAVVMIATTIPFAFAEDDGMMLYVDVTNAVGTDKSVEEIWFYAYTKENDTVSYEVMTHVSGNIYSYKIPSNAYIAAVSIYTDETNVEWNFVIDWTGNNLYIPTGDRVGTWEIYSDCSHESYTDGKCDACGTECRHKNITDGKCDDCGAEGIFVTITMNDSYGDGWSGNAVVIEQLIDGTYTEVARATIDDRVKSGTFAIILPEDGVYAFKWVDGSFSYECSFTVTVNGEMVYEAADGSELADGQVIYVLCEHIDEGFKPSLNAQTNSDGSQIRFVTCVDSLNYKEVGFVITNANNKEQTTIKTSKTVYTSIIAGGKTVTAEDITENEDMKYILTYTVTGLDKAPDSAFEVTSFVVNLDGTKTYGETKTFTLADMLG